MQIKSGEIHIWEYNSYQKDIFAENIPTTLSPIELQKASAFINKKDADNYICHHYFLRNTLSKYLQTETSRISFKYSEFGKPEIENSGLFFNLSYRGRHSLLAVSRDRELGIDLEEIRQIEDPYTFATVYFTDKEKEYIFSKPTEKLSETIILLWTMKEAFIKAIGKGLSVDIGKIDLSDFFKQEVNFISYNGNEIWTIKNIQAPAGIRASVAIKGEVYQIHQFKYEENN